MTNPAVTKAQAQRMVETVTVLNPNKLTYTMDEAANALGLSKSTVYRLVREGELSTFTWCGRTLIRADVLQVLVDRRSPPKVIPTPETAMPTCGVYLLFDRGALAYVGRSTGLRIRLRCHRKSGRRFDETRIIPCDEATSVWLERELIRTLRPSQNLLRYARRAALAERDLVGFALDARLHP